MQSSCLSQFPCMASNCWRSSKKGGTFNLMFNLSSISWIINLLSAMIDIPGLSSSLERKSHSWPSSMSEIEPTYTGDMYKMNHTGVHTGYKNFAALWWKGTPCWWLHVKVWWCLSKHFTSINDGISCGIVLLEGWW